MTGANDKGLTLQEWLSKRSTNTHEQGLSSWLQRPVKTDDESELNSFHRGLVGILEHRLSCAAYVLVMPVFQ